MPECHADTDDEAKASIDSEDIEAAEWAQLIGVSAVPASTLGRRCDRALLLGALALAFLTGFTFRANFPRPLQPPPLQPPPLRPPPRSVKPKRVAAGWLSIPGTNLSITSEEEVQPPMRLLINSHVKYKQPLRFLLASLAKKAKFDRWRDVVIVFGGSEGNIGPRRMLIGKHEMVVVNTTLNAYDYTALSAVWHFRDHPMVRADTYFYLPDSASVGAKFTQNFKTLHVGIDPVELRKPALTSSNICVFGSGLVRRWKSSYDRNFTKAEAVRLEIRGGKYTAGSAKPMIWWAKGRIHNLQVRRRVGSWDVYDTGFARDVVWYPEFDVYKYILPLGFGDITDGVKHGTFR